MMLSHSLNDTEMAVDPYSSGWDDSREDFDPWSQPGGSYPNQPNNPYRGKRSLPIESSEEMSNNGKSKIMQSFQPLLASLLMLTEILWSQTWISHR